MYGIRYGDENNSLYLDVFLKLWFVAQTDHVQKQDTEANCSTVQVRINDAPKNVNLYYDVL